VKRAGLVLLARLICGAQTAPLPTGSASVSGSIFDERGGPVIAARLSLQGEGTPLYLAKSTEQGAFRFARMEPGKYTLTIDQPGFCKIAVPPIAVAAGEQKILPRVTLKVPPDGQECE
jgi:hypothetical protein